MRTSDFDYRLPPRAIAQPPALRDHSRMLVLHRSSGRTEHRTIHDLPSFLQRGDLIVLNDTKVFRARLRGVVCRRGGALSPPAVAASFSSPSASDEAKPIELLLVRPMDRRRDGNDSSPSRRSRGDEESQLLDFPRGETGGAMSSPRDRAALRELEGVGSENRQSKIGNQKFSVWLVLARPARRLRVGASVAVGRMRGTVLGHEPDGSVRIQFDRSASAVIAYADRIGEIPTPPYVSGRVQRLADYQTTYARHTGSVAAPTAGFHVTPRLLRALNKRGVHVARITLHVGLGTFQPIRTEKLEDHTMHAEWVSIPAATTRAITSAKSRGNRVIAIGTTTLRALEGAASLCHPEASPRTEGSRRSRGKGLRAPNFVIRHSSFDIFSGPVSLFITPGFRFQVVDALLTNFHLPRSTLLVLVSAFAAPGDPTLRGRDMVLRAYRSALRRGYRFYSFGDAMLIR